MTTVTEIERRRGFTVREIIALTLAVSTVVFALLFCALVWITANGKVNDARAADQTSRDALLRLQGVTSAILENAIAQCNNARAHGVKCLPTDPNVLANTLTETVHLPAIQPLHPSVAPLSPPSTTAAPSPGRNGANGLPGPSGPGGSPGSPGKTGSPGRTGASGRPAPTHPASPSSPTPQSAVLTTANVTVAPNTSSGATHCVALSGIGKTCTPPVGHEQSYTNTPGPSTQEAAWVATLAGIMLMVAGAIIGFARPWRHA